MENNLIALYIAEDLSIALPAVKSTVELFSSGATVPFISRYRKEKTGGLDETRVRAIQVKLNYYTELEKRKETVIKTIDGLGLLTPALEKEIAACREKQKLEDLYLPFKPKKRTRATIAKEKGLQPLADIMMEQLREGRKQEIVLRFLNPDKGVNTYEDALLGAGDIVAEMIADNARVRSRLREYAWGEGVIIARPHKDWAGKKSKFETYYNFSEPLKKSPSHRILAIRRGAAENVLIWKIEVDPEGARGLIEEAVIVDKEALFYPELCAAITDSYKRLLSLSIETEVFLMKLAEAEKEAISVFSKNLENLLLASPAGHKVIMGVDPGFRTGVKVVVIDRNSNYKEYAQIFPHSSEQQRKLAQQAVAGLIKKHGVDIIAIGNGTASKETNAFFIELLKQEQAPVLCIVVSEAGASVYSASETAVKEFPGLDVTVRGAISIARRLQDPLAELVKIEPKAIGVGQYQHDVNQAELQDTLDYVVESCVNHVGVNLNTASEALLSYVSGIGKTIASNIVSYRAQYGSFNDKNDLLKVARLGNKVFEQCAGFLRIPGGNNPLDNSAIHPERYSCVEQMARDRGIDIRELIGNEREAAKIDCRGYVRDDLGLLTLNDIVKELCKPGLDPRKEFSCVSFNTRINEIDDLSIDMVLEGTVTNVTNFGAFVDIGVHQDGLIHISRLSNTYVKSPYDVVSVGDAVKVKVIAIDKELKRIGLERIVKA
ncbi:MAG: Tex family protein [Candidatus Omnitrophota bacterium]